MGPMNGLVPESDRAAPWHHGRVTPSERSVHPAAPPSAEARAAASARLADLATPAGALGRLGDLAVWVAAVQDSVPPRPIERIRAVVFAGDHGVAAYGVSAYPAAVTPAMVRTVAAGRAGVSVLAAQHGVALRVLDVAVDDDLKGLDPAISAHQVRRGSGAIHLGDALTVDETRRALAVGEVVAAEEIAAGADLLIAGDLGIGNTTVAAALIAACTGHGAAAVVGRGTGIDDVTLAHKAEVIGQALTRAADRTNDPVDLLTALGGADFAATAAFLAAAARAGVPVLLDGVISLAAACVAETLAPGAAAWFAAGHRSPEPAQAIALDHLGLHPLLDLDLRLGEGSGAMAAVPLVRSAAQLLAETALLSEVLGPA